MELEDASNFCKPTAQHNLGIGLPTMVSAYVPVGERSAGNRTSAFAGSRRFRPYQRRKSTGDNPSRSSSSGSDQAFAMFRGGHMNVSMVAAMHVSKRGDLANWTIPGEMVKGMGGAMDLVASGDRVIIAVEHNAKDGAFKIVEECSVPLTGRGVVHGIVTEPGWCHVSTDGLEMKEIFEGVTKEEVEKRRGCQVHYSQKLCSLLPY